MTPLGLVHATDFLTPRPTTGSLELQLQLEDTLASDRRLWVRGRLLDPSDPPRIAVRESSWWGGWRTRPKPPTVETVHMRTQVGRVIVQTDVPLSPDGTFEALLETGLPLPRQGWHEARHQVTYRGRFAQAAGVVLAPSNPTTGAVIVLLPVDFTYEHDGPVRLSHSEKLAPLAALFQLLQRTRRGLQSICYLACFPPREESRHAELALAAATLGWPPGHFVLLPAEREKVAEVFATAVDRLRWLFSGALDLSVLNLEPAAAAPLSDKMHPRMNRAVVRRFVNAQDDPWTLGDEFRISPIRNHVASLRPVRAHRVPRYPVVFCHGMLAMSMLRMQLPEQRNYFYPLRDLLAQRGVRALFPHVAPTGGVVGRAEHLREQIERWTDEPINLIAHSMGGLDARYLITHLGLAKRVRSLTTIATPHHGSYMADWFCAQFHQRVPLLLTLETLGVDVDGFRDCRLASCQEFNVKTPNMPGVSYFSCGAAVSQARITPFLRRAWDILTPVEGPNDGLVSVASARWGQYLGTLSVDHFTQTPDGLFARPDDGFNSLNYFSRLIEDLARRGF